MPEAQAIPTIQYDDSIGPQELPEQKKKRLKKQGRKDD